jgi:hypothetical protein
MTDDCETEGPDAEADRSGESVATERSPDDSEGETEATDRREEVDDDGAGSDGAGTTESTDRATGSTDSGAEADVETEIDGPDADDGTDAEEEYETDDGAPDGYAFERLRPETLPPDVQYTPEFDEDWVYPSGAKSGGTRDHTPVQGLELGVVGTADQLRPTVEAVLHGLSVFYRYAGSYPRHRIIKSEGSFERTSSGDVGVVAVIQPRPDAYDGLIEHMDAMRADEAPGPDVLTPNRETARTLVRILDIALSDADADSIDDRQLDAVTGSGWDAGRRIADTSIVERYAPLAADVLFDPTDDPVDLDGPGLDSVDQLAFEPHYLTADGPDGG